MHRSENYQGRLCRHLHEDKCHSGLTRAQKDWAIFLWQRTRSLNIDQNQHLDKNWRLGRSDGLRHQGSTNAKETEVSTENAKRERDG